MVLGIPTLVRRLKERSDHLGCGHGSRLTRDGRGRRESHHIARRPAPLHRLLEGATEKCVVSLNGRGRQASRPKTIVEVVEILGTNIVELPTTETIRRHTSSDASVALDRPSPSATLLEMIDVRSQQPVDREVGLGSLHVDPGNEPGQCLAGVSLSASKETKHGFGRPVIGSRPAYARSSSSRVLD